MTTWPEYLLAAMRAAGISSPAELSRKTKVTQPTLSRWLRGETTPSLDSLREVAEVLHRPFLEVAVAAGALTTKEARMKDAPAKLEPGDEDELVRLARRVRPEFRASLIKQLEALVDRDDRTTGGRKIG